MVSIVVVSIVVVGIVSGECSEGELMITVSNVVRRHCSACGYAMQKKPRKIRAGSDLVSGRSKQSSKQASKHTNARVQ